MSKEASINIFLYFFLTPKQSFITHSIDFYWETKTQTDPPTSFWERKVDIPNNYFGGGGGGGKSLEVYQ